jgi:hypothetical protein
MPQELSRLWAVGDIDCHNLNNAQPYGAWTVNIRLPCYGVYRLILNTMQNDCGQWIRLSRQ